MAKSDVNVSVETLLGTVMPQLSGDEDAAIIAEVLLALKMEGILGEQLTAADHKLVKMVADAIRCSDDKKEQALILAREFGKKGQPHGHH